jgi:hypothetical protein
MKSVAPGPTVRHCAGEQRAERPTEPNCMALSRIALAMSRGARASARTSSTLADHAPMKPPTALSTIMPWGREPATHTAHSATVAICTTWSTSSRRRRSRSTIA